MDERQFDSALARFLSARAANTPPMTDVPELAARVRSRVTRRRAASRARSLIAIVAVTVVAASIVARGPTTRVGAPVIAEPVTSGEPWSFSLAGSACATRPLPPRGPLPTATPSMPAASNGVLAYVGAGGVRLIDPRGDAGPIPIALGGPRDGVPGWPAWSPDGRVVTLYWDRPECAATVLVSSDGARAVVLPTVDGDAPSAVGATWSPDGTWLAVQGFGRTDVLHVDPTLRVTEARTVWSDVGPPGFMAWGPDGTLAIQRPDDRGGSLVLLRPGETTASPLDDPCQTPIAWVAGRIVCVGRSVDHGHQLTFIDRLGSIETVPLDLDLAPRGTKYLDIPLRASAGRVYFTAMDQDGWIDAYSVSGAGTDLRKLTATGPDSLPPDWLAPAPDGRSIAFSSYLDDRLGGYRVDEPAPGLWVRDLDTGDERLLAAGGGPIDWQPVASAP